MRDNNFRQASMDRHELENDKLDRDLDAALAKFAAAEPRAGLEERILATLRADQHRVATRSWWRWPVLATLAAALVFSASIARRSAKPVQNTTSPRPVMEKTGHAETQVANNIGGSPIRPHEAASEVRLKRNAIGHPVTVVAHVVKLDQFPSPQPLSEQEKILAGYVTRYPQHAALVARARTEELRRDQAEEMSDAAPTHDQDLQQSNK
jgi:hypothetical protein